MTTTAHQQDIVISGPEPLVIDPTSAKRRPVLNSDEARMLTTEIQRTSVRLWLLVTEAHDRAAHFALGYDSWDDYVRAEFKMSPSRSYQLVDTGHVMRELAVAGADLDHIETPPTRVVAKVKDRLPEIRKATRAALKEGEDPIKVLRKMATAPRIPTQRAGDNEPVESPDARAPEVTSNLPRIMTVTCPACGGDGKVTRSLGNRLRTFMKGLAPTE
jgi:hypothetical protein